MNIYVTHTGSVSEAATRETLPHQKDGNTLQTAVFGPGQQSSGKLAALPIPLADCQGDIFRRC